MKNRVLTLVEGRPENNVIWEDLQPAAAKLGWTLARVDYIDLLRISENRFDDLFSNFVWWRTLSLENSFIEGLRVVRWLETHGRIILNSEENVTGGFAVTSNKFFQQGIFMEDKVLKEYLLSTYEVKTKADLLWLLKEGKISFPLVLKPQHGTTGKGIVFIGNRQDINEYNGPWGEMIAVKYIPSDGDYRVFVIGGKCVGAMHKTWQNKNNHNFRVRSGGEERVGVTNKKQLGILAKIAERAIKISGLDYGGVDIIQDKETGKYYLLEVNSCAGWQNGFVEATGVDPAEEVIKWFEREGKKRGML